MIEQPGEPAYWNGIKTFKWKGHTWIKRPLWGIIHESCPISWADEESVEITDDDHIKLPVKYKPKYGHPIARTWVRTVEEFKYGTFEWTFILPKGEWLWPALWMESDAGWPPEIDCLEGWSEENPNYLRSFLYKRVHPTVHWSENADEKNGEHFYETNLNTLRFLIKGNGKVNTAKVVWTPKYVDIYYNKIKIKRFNNPEMLKHLNKEGYNMHPIMSMEVHGNKWNIESENQKLPKIYNDFEILDFKYYPL